MNTITVRDWLALPEKERPPARYKDEIVTGAYRDPSWRDDERYVIKLGHYGAGSKKPDTLLTVPDPPATKLKVVEHLDRKWVIMLGQYRNGRTSLTLMPENEQERDAGDDYITVSVNLYDTFLESGHVHIKTWDYAHENIVAHLVAAGVVEDTGRQARAGYTWATICKLTLGPGDTIN